MKTYKMPSGEETEDVDLYIDAWKAVAIPVCDMLTVRLGGFDPDFLFSSGDTTISLPAWFVEKIGQVVKENKRMRGALRWYKECAVGLYVNLHGPDGWACNVTSREFSELCADAGKRAREALGEE